MRSPKVQATAAATMAITASASNWLRSRCVAGASTSRMDITPATYSKPSVGRPNEGLLYVAGVMSMREVLAPATQRLRSQLLALAVIAMVAAAVAWTFGDRILARPVQRLLGRVEALARE